MSMNGSDEITAEVSLGKPDGRFLSRFRSVALCAVVAGAVGSVGLMLRAGRRNDSLLLMVLFTIWVLSPFIALAWANAGSQRWSVLTRTTLYCVTLVLTLGSLAIYSELIKRPKGTPNAFVFIVVPPASWLLMTIALAIAALISRRLSSRGTGP